MKKVIFPVLLFIFSSAVFAQTKEVVIPGSQVRTITSSIVKGQEYELQILLPGSYNKSDQKYPVVYLMDSQWDFPLVKSLYGQQYYDGFIPELIIVGVTWGGVRPNADSLRARDYTPTREQRLPQSGGADNFLSFMKSELFPFIETNYRASNQNRTIMGCSLGGLITLYALYAQPDLFENYVAASPAFLWDRQVIYQLEGKFTDQQPGKRLYMTMGEVENTAPDYRKFEKNLLSRKYNNLKLESRILENTGHSGTKAEGFSRGLRYVFKRNEITPSAEILNKYIGRYTFPNKGTIELMVENGKLVIYVSYDRHVLYAESETSFFAKSAFLNIQFTSTGLQLNRYNSTMVGIKTK